MIELASEIQPEHIIYHQQEVSRSFVIRFKDKPKDWRSIKNEINSYQGFPDAKDPFPLNSKYIRKDNFEIKRISVVLFQIKFKYERVY